MNRKVVTSACFVLLGLILGVAGYLRLHSMAGPARNVPPGFADNAMMLIGVGAVIGLVGAAAAVFFALRER